MGVICISSLKGGVGKTTVSVNVSAAFAARDCETLLIDLDPTAHATRYFNPEHVNTSAAVSAEDASPSLANCFLGPDFSDFQAASSPGDGEGEEAFHRQRLENSLTRAELLRSIVRPQLSVIPGGAELRHFLWGRGARVFRTLFPMLIEQLRSMYDYIVIDTPPDFNVLTRNAIAQSDLVVVPVDSSAMSIHCLEQLVASAEHIKGPAWSIVRTMVNKQATRSRACTDERLNRNLFLTNAQEQEDLDSMDMEFDSSNPEQFMAFLEQHERMDRGSKRPKKAASTEKYSNTESPIFLLDSITYRTEQQNRMTFVGKTCFDSKAFSALSEQYLKLARELEQLIGLSDEVQELPDINASMDFSGFSANAN